VQTPDALALILVDRADRRMLPALRLVASLQDFETRAVHVSVDAAQSERLANDWLTLGLTWVPLEITEPKATKLVESVHSVVEEAAADRRRVLVIVPELELAWWWQRALHRSTGRRIARRLAALRRVSTIVVPCSP
jgi:hypothetical protein